MDYQNYLKVPDLLKLQKMESEAAGKPAHDEMLFIIIHQTYELWFKQILFEVDSIAKMLSQNFLEERTLSLITHRSKRVVEILDLLVKQIDIIETMTPMDFLDFRDYLVPASGFQSLQFRVLEAKLGLKFEARAEIEKTYLQMRIPASDLAEIKKLDQQKNLLELVDGWLARFPYLKTATYDYWLTFQITLNSIFENEQKIIEKNITGKEKEMQLLNLEHTKKNFALLFDEKTYQAAFDQKQVSLSQKAMRSALFIYLHRLEPLLALPHQFLTALIEIDEKLTQWRQRHALMVQRTLGSKVGTGGSSGHQYLSQTVDRNRIFADFFNLTSFLIPNSKLPVLPEEIIKKLQFQ
jgi:tryptophan 2,3-dioxygenase